MPRPTSRQGTRGWGRRPPAAHRRAVTHVGVELGNTASLRGWRRAIAPQEQGPGLQDQNLVPQL
eukprot:3157117-Alexandrium_andersonii.AAC.1